MSSDSPVDSGGGSSQDKNKKLRRPYASTLERLKNGELESSPEAMVKSTLSADAPEFVPKSAQHSQPQQDEAFYDKFQQLVSIRPSHLTGAPASDTASALDMFKDAVFQLTSNPGPMVEYLAPIIDHLYKNPTDKSEIDQIIDIIIVQSVSEPNFRFTGAKVCKHLTEALRNHPVFNNFRAMFLNKCSAEFGKREELMMSNKERLCGLSMFFGELFLVLEIQNDGVNQKIGKLRMAISGLLSTLLSVVDDVTVQCACKLLKLTGQAIMETTDLDGNFTDTFAKIKSLEKSPALDKTSHCLVNSVLSRLEYNFGVGMQPSPEKPTSRFQDRVNDNYQVNEPVFYNAAGQPMTMEEAGYCAGDGDIEGLSQEEHEMFLQFEAENLANQQWLEQTANGYQQQQQQEWLDQGGDSMIRQQFQSDMQEYTQWSSSQDPLPYNFEEPDYYGDYSGDMDDEMFAAYEMFLRESGQQGQR